MAYTSYKNDIFISYAHADNVAEGSGKGWVEQFHDELKKTLPQRLLGVAPEIFFDHSRSQANHQLKTLLTEARNSAVFLAITSPSYAARPWTRDELAEFVGHNRWDDQEATRLFALERLEPENRNAYPAPLSTHIGLQFWEKTDRGVAVPLRPRQEEYFIKLNELADDIAKKLREMHAAAAKPAPPPQAAEKSAALCVLLAQVTDDLEDERAQVRSYLEQYEIAVVPAAPYPQGGEEFRAAFAADLGRAGLFVQLLGILPGRRPPDLPEGYTAFQAKAAADRGIAVMQWRSPELKLDAVANADQRRMLAGEHVIADGLESFKRAVKERVTRPPASPRVSALSSIFIDAAKDDLEIARQIQQELQPLPSSLPVLTGAPEEVRTDLEENIVDCGVLVLVNGQTTPLWVRGQLRLYNKLKARRSGPPRVLEIVIEPPENKEEHGMWLEELHRIRVRAPVDKEALRPLIAALGA